MTSLKEPVDATTKFLAPTSDISGVRPQPSEKHLSFWRHPWKASKQSRRAAYSDEPNPDEIVDQNEIPNSWWLTLTAILLQVLVAVFLVVVVFVNVWIKKSGVFSTFEQHAYVVGTAVLASLITAFTASEARRLWLENFSANTHRDVRRARLVLGVGQLIDKIWFLQISASALVVGLITTAIIAGITPTITSRQHQTLGTLKLAYTSDNQCFYDEVENATDTTNLFAWPVKGGNVTILYPFGIITCPFRTVVPEMSVSVHASAVQGIAYLSNGVSVAPSAIGTPALFGGLTQFSFGAGDLRDAYGPLLHLMRQCFPVVYRNPVQCGRNGNVTSVTEYSINATTSTGECSIGSTFTRQYPTTKGATAMGVCTKGLDVGQAIIMMAGVGNNAASLARAFGDETAANTTLHSYVVTCFVDVAPAIDFRVVTLSRAPDLTTESGKKIEASYAYAQSALSVNSSGASCMPQHLDGSVLTLGELLLPDTLATGASALWPLLMEGASTDGWSLTLSAVSAQIYERATLASGSGGSGDRLSFNFNNSSNPLEDALGLAIGMALGNFWGQYDLPYEGYANATYAKLNGTAEIQGLRVGSGSLWALLYIIPELWAIGLLSYRWITLSRHSKLSQRHKQGTRIANEIPGVSTTNYYQLKEVASVASIRGRTASSSRGSLLPRSWDMESSLEPGN